MLSPEKVATPLTAAWVSVPVSVPLLGLVPIATVMFPVNPVAVLPLPSWAVTSTAGVIAAPAVVVLGCTLNTHSATGGAARVGGEQVSGVAGAVEKKKSDP